METIATTLALTTRAVSILDLEGRPARRTLMSRSFATGVDDLWDALTNPERIPRWFLPVTGEFRVGGRYQLEGNAGGTIEVCDAPSRLRVTWEMGGAATWLTLTLRASETSTVLELEHIGEVPEELWAHFGPSATGMGWDMAFHGLSKHVSTGATLDPAEAAAWMASSEGLAFMQTSADLWQQSDIATGTSADDAVARAQRTIAVYTGQAEPPSHG